MTEDIIHRMFPLLLALCIYGVGCIPHVDIYPYPIARIAENGNLTLTCLSFELLGQIAFGLEPNYTDIYINQDDCKNTTGQRHMDPTPDMTFSCNLARSTFTMTFINVTKARNGQRWYCRVPVRGLPVGSSQSKTTTVVVEARRSTPRATQRTTLRHMLTSAKLEVHLTPPLSTSTRIWMMTSFNNTSITSHTKSSTRTTITHETTISTPNSNMTATTPSSTTNVAPQSTARALSFEPDPADYTIQMGLLLKVNLPFKEIYDNRSSPEFQSLAINFSVSLTDIYKSIIGFKAIDVLRFRPGSVIVDYVVKFYPTVNIETITSEIQTKVVSSLTIVAGASVDIHYTREVMNEKLATVRDMDLCSLTSEDLCPFGYSCKRSRWSPVLCVDRCNSTVCQNNGECYIDHHNSDVQCRCSIISDIAYSGSRCEIKAEVIPAEVKNLYLIISCSIAGGILIIAIIIVCVMKRKLAAQKKKNA